MGAPKMPPAWARGTCLVLFSFVWEGGGHPFLRLPDQTWSQVPHRGCSLFLASMAQQRSITYANRYRSVSVLQEQAITPINSTQP
jgi:hypothetical protein